MCDSVAKLLESKKEQLKIAEKAIEKILRALFVNKESDIFWGKNEDKGLSSAQICQLRIKEASSIEKKIAKKQKHGDNRSCEDIFNSLTDLVGGRLVFTTAAEAKAAGRFINVHFHVDDFNSGDKAETKKEEEFGYLSVHHIIILKDDFFRIHKDILELEPEKVEEYAKLFKESPLKLEIQTRSLLQHAWAETAHNTIYKPGENMDIPPESKRRLNSIAAVLENADNSINDLMYLFNVQKTQSENKYMQIAKALKEMNFSALNNWNKHSLKSILFEINEFIKFHPCSVDALTVKVMAKALLVLNDEKITFPDSKSRTTEDKLKITYFKDRRDDIFNTLMTIIRLLNQSGKIKAKNLPQQFAILEQFCKKNKNDNSNFIKTIELAIKLSKPKNWGQRKYVYWMCDLKRVEKEVEKALFDTVTSNQKVLEKCFSLCMIHPTGGNAERGYTYDDSDQLAKILPGKKQLFCADLSYSGGSKDWGEGAIKTENRRYSLYEALYLLDNMSIDPRKIKFIGYNLQRIENTLCRFALAIGAPVLIIRHQKMNRYRSIMYESERANVGNFTVCDISENKKITDFLEKKNRCIRH